VGVAFCEAGCFRYEDGGIHLAQNHLAEGGRCDGVEAPMLSIGAICRLRHLELVHGAGTSAHPVGQDRPVELSVHRG